MTVSEDALVGTSLGGWTLVRKCGEGAMGVVFEARSAEGTRAAVKVVRPELTSRAGVLERFHREAKTLARVRHPNVVSILDSGESNGNAFIALDFVDGPPLTERLGRRGAMSADEARGLVADVLSGLAAIHDAGVIHRDVKPANVLLGADGRWRLADFGLARREGAEESVALTRPGTLMGTPHYMSPEQCRGEPCDARSDLYAAGASLFHAFAGRPPFPLTDLLGVLQAHIDVRPPDIAREARVPADVAAVIMRCLEKSPGRRPQSARAALAMLGAPPAAPPEAPPPEPASPAPEAPAFQTIAAEPRRLSVSASGRVQHASSGSHRALAAPAPVAAPPRSLPWRPALVPAGLAVGVLVLHSAGLVARLAPELPPSVGDALVAADVRWNVAFLVLVALAGFRFALGVFAGAPAGGATNPLERARLRFVTILFSRSSPATAAQAFVDLGEPASAAPLFLEAGRYSDAAQAYARAGNLLAAGGAYERMQDHARALDVYAKANAFDQAARVAFESANFNEAGKHFVRARRWDEAVEAYRKAGRPLRAAEALEQAGRPYEAAEELAQAWEEEKGPFRHASEQERRAVARKIAELYDAASAGRRAAPFYEAAGEHATAARRHEEHGAVEEAARLAKLGKDFARAAELYDQAGRVEEAASCRAELHLAKGDRRAAAESFERAGKLDRAADFYEKVKSFEDAARCALGAGDPARAADLLARGGDHARAGALFEKASAWQEAARCYRAADDAPSEARALERAGDLVGASGALRRAKDEAGALRVLAAVRSGSPQRKEAQALRGDLLAAMGKDAEAAEAYAEGLEGVPVDAESSARIVRCAEVLARLGRIEAALSYVRRLKGSRFAQPSSFESTLREKAGRKTRGDAPAPEPPAKPRLASTRASADLVGAEVDRHKVLSLIGEGATAWVFKAEHVFLKRIEALKVLKPALSTDEAVATRFLKEGSAVAALRHPNLIEVHDCGRSAEGLLYMALEFLPGGSLRDHLKKTPRLPVPEAGGIVVQVLAGLSAAHKAGLVHRDLKPENILFGAARELKVVDFGIAKAFAEGATATGAFLGTPRYASPEQVKGEEAGPASDQYASALILFELLAGRPPFESAAPLGYLLHHAHTQPPVLATLAPEVPAELSSLVMRALEKDPKARHADVDAFAALLRPFAGAP